MRSAQGLVLQDYYRRPIINTLRSSELITLTISPCLR